MEELLEEFQYVESKMENEGIGYYILDCVSSAEMPDKKSEELFENARIALIEFTDYIQNNAKAI